MGTEGTLRRAIVLAAAVLAFACLGLLVFSRPRERPAPVSPPATEAEGGAPAPVFPARTVFLSETSERVGLLALVRGAGEEGLRGSLLGGDGVPVPGAWIKIDPVEPGRGFSQCVVTDGEGRFDFGRVPPRRYRVVVEGGGGYAFGLAAGEVLYRGGSITLTIRLPDTLLLGRLVPGRAAEPDVRAASGLRVDLFAGSRLAGRARPGEDLSFAIRGVRPGRYRLRVEGRGFAAVEREVEVRSPRTEVQIPLEPVSPPGARARLEGPPSGRPR